MFLCANNECRARCLPHDDSVDIKDLPNRFEPQYILSCGHSLCEKCLYMVVARDERSLICDQCNTKTTFSARAYTSIKGCSLSNDTQINRINNGFATEIPIDAYSFGLAFCEELITASPVRTVTSPDELPKMSDSFKYSKGGQDEENVKLDALIPPARRNKTIPLIVAMHSAVSTHAECGSSLKVIGNLEKKLSKEFYEAKMRLRDKFQVLHSLLQLEEMKGISKFEEIYSTRKEELSQVEKHLYSVRRSISDTFQLEHGTMDLLTKKRNILKELTAKPSRISWRNYEIADEFNFHLDDYVKEVIKGSLVLKNNEKATTLTVEVIGSESNSFREPLPLFRSPPHHIPQIPAPGTSSSSSDLPNLKADILKSKVIPERRTVYVKLGRVFNPHHFYCILWDDEACNRKMFDEIEKWCTKTFTHPPPVNTIKPGKFIFVFYGEVNKWARAYILKVNADTEKANRKRHEFGKSVPSAYNFYTSISVDVQLLDYGGPYRVSYTMIRQPFEEIFDKKKWPYLALKCAVNNVGPRQAEWTTEVNEKIEEICGDYLMEMRIDKVTGDKHWIDLYHHETPHGVRNMLGLREALFGCQLVIITNTHSARHVPEFDLDSDRISFNRPEKIPTNVAETVLITAITNPDLFYVTRYSLQEKFHELHESLKVYFEHNDAPFIVYVPRRGMPCVGLDDGAFYRVEIIKLLQSDRVEVLFVDFGTTKVLEVANLRLIKEEFLKQPVHAIPCKLGDIEPIKFNWSDEAVGKFQELCFGGPSGNSYLFNISVADYDHRGKHIVNLRRYTGTEYISVNVAMVSLKYAISSGPITEIPGDTATISQYSTKLDDRIFKALEDFDVNGFSILNELVVRNREANSSKEDSYIKVRVSHWISPDEIYVQLTTPEVRSYFVCYENKLVDDFHKKLDNPVPIIQPRLMENEPVVYAQVEEFDVIWRRGIIVSREKVEDEIIGFVENGDSEIAQDKASTKYIVRARDFGYEKEVARKHIFKLPADSTYLKDGDFCIKCHICDILPAGGGPWTKTALEGFAVLLKNYQQELFVEVVEKRLPSDKTQSVPIDLIARNCYIPDGLARDHSKYYSFQSLLITKGFAIPTMKIDLDDHHDNPIEENIPVKRSLIPFTNRKGDSVLGYIRNARAAVQRQMDNTTVRFYKEPEKPQEQSFIALPTEVGLNLKIWFRIHRIEGPQLINVINRSITNALKDQDELLPFDGDTIYGRACTAFFEFDKTWNRAEVLYPLDEDRTFVRFVDYGNEVPVKKEEMSSQVFHPEIPKLALHALLANCKSNAQGREAEQIQHHIHQLIIDHKCVMNWINYLSLKEMRISIIMPDGVDLTEYLIKNNSLIERAITDDQTLIAIPPMVRDILSRLPLCGYKPSTLKFEENCYYPVCITGTFRDNFTFIQPKPVHYPSNEVEEEITKRTSEFLEFLSKMRVEVSRFEKVEEVKTGDAVAAQFSDDQWYRGMIVEKANSIIPNQFRVFYVDYGNTSVVDIAKLRKLPTKYRENPELFAIPARVCNIKPGKIGRWSSYLNSLMEKELSLNELKTIALIKSRTDPWNIEVYIVDPEDPRAPSCSLWERLIKEGHLVEFKSSE